jgi:hypothetical protein
MKKARRYKPDPLKGKRDVYSQLYRAVRRYVEKHGGSVVVIGGIESQQWDASRPLNYTKKLVSSSKQQL